MRTNEHSSGILDESSPGSVSWSSFKDFLQSSNKKIYWITGKPGSGKSTLMKFIRENPLTSNMLQAWSGNHRVIQAAFYFWNSGLRMQMSVDGLLQTVLYDCLRQNPQKLQEVLPERWEAATLFAVDDYPWSLEELNQALRRLIMEVCSEQKFFVMIDGLDECSGDQVQLVELIRELAQETENLKLCVASRPWNNLEDAFKGRPSLIVQNITVNDIEFYVTSKFSTNEGFTELQVRDPSGARNLLEAIPKKAECVFLWVHLVVRSMLQGPIDGDGLHDLQKRLDELPPKLEDLYKHILEGLDEKYLDHASRLFQTVRACIESPTLFRIALADMEDSELAIQAPVKPMSGEERSALCKNMKRKLLSRCRGLQDISSTVVQHCSPEDEVDYGADTVSMGGLKVQYLHRSVRDYIQSPEIWSWLVSVIQQPFDPYLVLLKSHLLHMKNFPPNSLSAGEMGFHMWLTVQYPWEERAAGRGSDTFAR